MTKLVALAAMLALTTVLSACGKYGPPVRTVPPQSSSGREATQAGPQVPEENLPESEEFDDVESDAESGP